MEYIHTGNNKQCLKWIKHSHMNTQREAESFAVASCLRKASMSFFCIARSCPEKFLYEVTPAHNHIDGRWDTLHWA